jgi:HPt (histidine-containing phosphotransfer) domain-containing protein
VCVCVCVRKGKPCMACSTVNIPSVVQVEAKTRKLKKVWNKFQAAQQEIKDLQEEFQQEREDMLDTIRELNKQLKLKQLLLDSFVPAKEVERVR